MVILKYIFKAPSSGGPFLRMKRATRGALTLLLTIPSVSFLMVTEWFEDGLQSQVLAALVVRVVVLHPLGEYILHRLLHMRPTNQTSPQQKHDNHHCEIKKTHTHSNPFEAWCYVLALLCYMGGSFTRWAVLGLMQYAFFHQLSHDMPVIVPHIARFHGIHHLAPNRNNAISFSWPDRVFGTYLTEPPSIRVYKRVQPMIDGLVPPW